MRGLLLRLANLDPDAGASLRVIDYFDRLVNSGASLEAVTRATAALSDCTAGLRDEGSGLVLRFDADGVASPRLGAPVSLEAPVLVDGARVGTVWLERGEPSALDEIVLERMAVTAAARWRPGGAVNGPDPALVEVVISATADESDRVRALRLLGLAPDCEVAVLAVALPGTDLSVLFREIAAQAVHQRLVVRGALIGTMGALVTHEPDAVTELLRGLDADHWRRARVGVGSLVAAGQAPVSWVGAKVAARFSSVWRTRRILRLEDLGALACLAAVPRDRALASEDVAALARHAKTDGGELDVDAVLAVAAFGSARQAASELHLHHSSITNRVHRLESALGLPNDDPIGRLRAQVAAILWRLQD
ncbi:MAG: helix-turn-helix domain-containing protein [Actinomycetes bacterium]